MGRFVHMACWQDYSTKERIVSFKGLIKVYGAVRLKWWIKRG